MHLFGFNLPAILAISSASLYGSMVLAQSGATVGTIAGTVKDSQGGIIVGATIIVKQIETGVKRTTQVNELGFYSLPQLPPGTYKIAVTADGFIEKNENLTLSVGTIAVLDFELTPSGSSNVIEVIESNTVVSSRTESSTQILSQSIDSLPINLRSFLSFSFTTPRITLNRFPEVIVAPSSSLSVNSQPSRFNNITIDGLSNNDISTGIARSVFSQDAVQEFQIISDSYSAEFGRALGGVINIVTKTGTNKFHGGLFGLLRNSDISARNAFFSDKDDFRRYQLGLNLGGPIKRDKAFFFLAFERLIERKNRLVTISDEVIAAARRQNFLISNGVVSIPATSSSLIAKTNFNLTEKDFLAIRYNGDFTYRGDFDAPGGLSDLTNGAFSILNNQAIALSNTYVNSSGSFINETRFLYANLDQAITSYGEGPRVALSSPQGGVLFGRGRLFPQPRKEDTYQIVDNVTLIKGKHQIKFGIDANISQVSAQISLFSQGSASFDPLDFTQLSGIPNLPTFTALEAFDPTLRSREQLAFLTVLSDLLPSLFPSFPKGLDLTSFSLPLFYTQGFGSKPRDVPNRFFSGFIQDDIRLSGNLVLKTGLRYDLNRIRSLPNNSGNLSPRLALSYRPTSKLNISAAYGLFFAAPFSAPAILVENSKLDRLKLLTIIFPSSIIPFSLPNHRFEQTKEPPSGFELIRQFGNDFTYQPNLRNSYNQQSKLGIEYSPSNTTRIFADYIFVRGIKLFSSRDINPVIQPSDDFLETVLTGRLDPTRGRVIEYESGYDSYYHGVTFGIEKIFSKGFSFLANYTYSKSIDNFVDFSDINNNNSLNVILDRSLSLQDLRSNFVFSGIWNPTTKNPWLKDFQFSTIINLQSGTPYNIVTDDLNRDGVRGDRPLGLGRNVGIVPGFANIDLRIGRAFRIKELVKIECFIEAFNLFNRVNIFPESDPGVFFPTEKDGSVKLPTKQGSRFALPRNKRTLAFSPREAQVGFRISF
ncbi:MAG: TonB-dependent receptor [Acidobacteria bacterium]|nr:TonB-dependent receptor [Acidobacteriota bacterium]